MEAREISILSIRETNPTILRSRGSGTTDKKKQNQQTTQGRLIRWLDRLNHFDNSLKHTAGKEIKFTHFMRRNPTENPEPEENYEEEFVINAIAQLATVNARIGRIFNQSEGESTDNTTNMHDTHTLIDT